MEQVSHEMRGKLILSQKRAPSAEEKSLFFLFLRTLSLIAETTWHPTCFPALKKELQKRLQNHFQIPFGFFFSVRALHCKGLNCWNLAEQKNTQHAWPSWMCSEQCFPVLPTGETLVDHAVGLTSNEKFISSLSYTLPPFTAYGEDYLIRVTHHKKEGGEVSLCLSDDPSRVLGVVQFSLSSGESIHLAEVYSFGEKKMLYLCLHHPSKGYQNKIFCLEIGSTYPFSTFIELISLNYEEKG